MATTNEEPGRREIIDAEEQAAVVAADEASGTPAHLSAKARTAIYVGVVVTDTVATLILALLAIFGVITAEQAFQTGTAILAAAGTLSAGLALGYRPTRPGSPIAG